jgi:hypothetical protein
MATKATTVLGVKLLVMSDSATGRAQVMARSGARRVYLGEMFPQVVDDLYLHLSDPTPGIETWEPDREWPWKTLHATFYREYAALSWLVQRAVQRGDL